MSMVKLNFYLPVRLKEKLAKLARKNKVPMAAVIRHAVVIYLDDAPKRKAVR